MNFTQLRRLSIAALAFVLSFGAQTQAQVTLGELHIRNGLYTFSDRMNSKRSPRPIDVFSLGRLTLFGMVRLCARQGVPGELISEGVATA